MKSVVQKLKLLSVAFMFLVLPLLLSADSGSGGGKSGAELAKGFVAKINQAILYPLISLFIGVAVIVFLWGAFEYVYNADNDAGREKGRQHLLWGTIGLLVMVSAVAILNIAANTFDLGTELQNAR